MPGRPYAEGFRAPTLTEGQPPYGNPALKPETARNLDLGLEQALLDDQVHFGVTWFNRRSTNLIVFSWDSYQSENIGKVDTDGLEVALQVRPDPHLQFAANYTLTNAIKDKYCVRFFFNHFFCSFDKIIGAFLNCDSSDKEHYLFSVIFL